MVHFESTKSSKAGRVLFAPALGEWHEVFVLDGVMKRVWLRSEGTEYISRFTGPGDYDTLWCEWQMKREVSHWTVAATDCTVAYIPTTRLAALLDRHPSSRAAYEWEALRRLDADTQHAAQVLAQLVEIKGDTRGDRNEEDRDRAECVREKPIHVSELSCASSAPSVFITRQPAWPWLPPFNFQAILA